MNDGVDGIDPGRGAETPEPQGEDNEQSPGMSPQDFLKPGAAPSGDKEDKNASGEEAVPMPPSAKEKEKITDEAQGLIKEVKGAIESCTDAAEAKEGTTPDAGPDADAGPDKAASSTPKPSPSPGGMGG